MLLWTIIKRTAYCVAMFFEKRHLPYEDSFSYWSLHIKKRLFLYSIISIKVLLTTKDAVGQKYIPQPHVEIKTVDNESTFSAINQTKQILIIATTLLQTRKDTVWSRHRWHESSNHCSSGGLIYPIKVNIWPLKNIDFSTFLGIERRGFYPTTSTKIQSLQKLKKPLKFQRF